MMQSEKPRKESKLCRRSGFFTPPAAPAVPASAEARLGAAPLTLTCGEEGSAGEWMITSSMEPLLMRCVG